MRRQTGHNTSGRGPGRGRRAAILAWAALLLLFGCRSSEEPERKPRGSDLATTTLPWPTGQATQPAGSGHGNPLPATQFAPVNDPAGCLVPGCHVEMARVTYRHAPFQNGDCEVCHGNELPDHRFELKHEGVALCTFCHSVVGHRPHLHAAIEQDGCLACHDPHGSDAKFLLTRPSVELTCLQCHEVQRQAHLHGPFASGSCTACHQPHESDNPNLLLGGAGAEHCFVCHREMQAGLAELKAPWHEPLREGCTFCHEPHSSPYPYVLKTPQEELCLACHRDVADRLAEVERAHGALETGKGCGNCHDPHTASGQRLLRRPMPQLCLDCHDRPVQAADGHTVPDMRPQLLERKYLHGPVSQGDCSACHDGHVGRFPRLLKAAFPARFYIPFDVAEYALCFQCHSPGIVLEPETTTLTAFRDGSRNLHYVHVHRPEKGRTCRTCHETHGSNLPRHIAESVPFEDGVWSMPIGFALTADGGRCSPGCHEPKAYRRSRPVSVGVGGDGR